MSLSMFESMSESNDASIAPTNQKTTKSLAQRHLAKLREESLALRAQSDTFSAEVAALEELFARSEDQEAGGDAETEKTIWESLQRLLHKRYLAEMNSLRTAAALTGRQLPMKAPSTSSESDTSYASSPASNLPAEKLEDVGSRLTTSGDSSSDHGSEKKQSENDSTDTPPHSNDEGTLEDSEERGSVFSFSCEKSSVCFTSPESKTRMNLSSAAESDKSAREKAVHLRKPRAPPNEVVVPRPRWLRGGETFNEVQPKRLFRENEPKAHRTGNALVQPPPAPFGAVLNSTVPPASPCSLLENELDLLQDDLLLHSCPTPTTKMLNDMQAPSTPRTLSMQVLGTGVEMKGSVNKRRSSERAAMPNCPDAGQSAANAAAAKCAAAQSVANAAAAKCAAAMERSAAARARSRSPGHSNEAPVDEVVVAMAPPLSPLTAALDRSASAMQLSAITMAEPKEFPMDAAKWAAAMERSAAAMAASKEVPVKVPTAPYSKKVQAPLREPAPAAPKELRRGDLIAMAREARAAAAKAMEQPEPKTMRAHPTKADLDSSSLPPHLKEMADELKHQISELQSSFGVSRTAASSPDAGIDALHREAERAVTKARQWQDSAPQVPPPFHAVKPLKGAPPASTTLGLQTKHDHFLGQSAPNLPTYPYDSGLPRGSPRASPRESPRESPRASQFQGPQDLHSTAPTLTGLSSAQMQLRRPDASSPGLSSRGGRVSPSPSSSPPQNGRQGRNMPQNLPSQGYGHSQVPQGRRMPGYTWIGSKQTGLRY